MEQIFNKTLIDVVKTSRVISPNDIFSYLAQITAEVKNDLKNKSETVKQQALLKLFYLATEGQDVRWSEFNIINSMGANEYATRRIAFLCVHLAVDSESTGLIMLTNVYKKVIKLTYSRELQKSQNQVECSSALSSFGYICNKDLGESLLQQIMNLQGHSKPLIRKKALACLAKIFTLNPSLIPGNLEKVIQKLSVEEGNSSVLACGVSIMQQIMKVTPSLFPLFMQFIIDQLQKSKSNWLLIRLIRLSNTIIAIEPRFQRKLIDVIQKLINQTHSKSIQYELINTVLRYFKDQKNLYNSAVDILKVFIDHSDVNLRSLGLQCLDQMLLTDPQQITEFQEKLMESFIKGDYFSKLQVINLYRTYTFARNYNWIVENLLKAVEDEIEQPIRDRIIECLIFITQKDKFSNVDDPELLFVNFIPKLVLQVKSEQNAHKLRDLLFDLLARIPDLYPSSDQFLEQIFKGLTHHTEDGVNQVTFNVIRMDGATPEINYKDCLYQAMFLIAAESARFQDLNNLIKNLNLISNFKSMNIYRTSTQEIHSMLSKILINIIEKLQTQEKKIDSVARILSDKLDPELNQKNGILKWSLERYFQTCQKLQLLSEQKVLNIYEELIVQTISTSLKVEVVDLMSEKTQQQIIINLVNNHQILQQSLVPLKRLFEKDLPPIHPDAQKYVQVPDGLDLHTPLSICEEEIEKIKQINTAQQGRDQPQQSTVVPQTIQQQEKQQTDQNAQIQNIQVQELQVQKRGVTINRDDALPNGVSQEDLQRRQNSDDE